MHTSQWLNKLLLKRLPKNKIVSYIKKHTFVSPPKMSLHSFVACADDQSCIIESGRGNIWFPANERKIGMSNCPVCDYKATGIWEGFGVDRQMIVDETLDTAPSSFGVADAFKLLDAVHQVDEVWNTEFSFVYSYNQNKVYYCYDHQFDQIKEYQMQA